MNDGATTALKMEKTLRIRSYERQLLSPSRVAWCLMDFFSKTKKSIVTSFCTLLIQGASSPIILNDSRSRIFCVSRSGEWLATMVW